MLSSSTVEQLDWLELSIRGADDRTYVDHEVRVVMEEVGKVAFTDEQFADIVESIRDFVAWRASIPFTKSSKAFKFFTSELGKIETCAKQLRSLTGVDADYNPHPLRASLMESINLHGFGHDRINQLRKLLDDLIQTSRKLDDGLHELTAQTGRPKKLSGNLICLIDEIKGTWLEAGGQMPGPVGGRHTGEGNFKGGLFDFISTILRARSEVLDGPISDLAPSGILKALQILRDSEQTSG